MKVVLPIDPFQLTQGFGENPQAYAQFGLKGHNGWDIRTKYFDTPQGRRFIMAPQDAVFFKKDNEGSGGYGLYFEVKTKTSKNTWKHTFAHCHSIETFTEKKQGENMAISDNTGNSTGAHLHWTVKRLNPDGTVKDYNNGYFGAVNPQEYVDEVRADGVTPPISDLDNKKLHQFDLVCIELNKGGYAPTPASEYWFENPQDPDKFTNLIKKLIRDSQGSQVYIEGIKKEARNKTIEDVKVEVEKLKV